MKLNVLKKRTLRLEQLENRELLSATTWDNAAQADAAVAAEMASTLAETETIELKTLLVTTANDVVDANDEYLSLREAFAAAQNGDTIKFDAALYNETTGQIELSLTQGQIDVAKTVTVDALEFFHFEKLENNVHDQEATGVAIDVGEATGTSSRAFEIKDGGNLTMIGVTVSGASLVGSADEYHGGAYHVLAGGSLTLEGCVVENSHAQHGGGGIAVAGTLTLSNTIVQNCDGGTDNGGGVWVNNGTATVRDSFIRYNQIDASNGSTSGGGGGVAVDGGTYNSYNTTYAHNDAWFGGGLFFSSEANVLMVNDVVVDNGSHANVNIFTRTGTYEGGGINIDGATVTLVNCTVADNGARSGGGIYVNSDAGLPSDLTLVNTIVVENESSNWLGNVVKSDIQVVKSDSVATTVNGYNSLTTFGEWDNADGADTNISYRSDIQLFTDLENHDITLADNSQAIDAGNLELAVQYAGAENVLRDYQNNNRVNEGGALDLGGVEYGSTPYYALAAPTELAFSAYDSEAGTVVLSWADSNANTRAFRVEVSTDGGSTWTFAGEALAANPSLTLNVDAETSYIFRVRAEKTISAVSAWATAAWEPATLPQTPGAINFMQQQGNLAQFAPGAEFKDEYLDDAWVSVSWDYCENKPEYELRYRVAGEGDDAWITVECEAEPKKISDGSTRPKAGVYLDVLTPGETYEFQVRSVDPNNAANVSEYTEISTFTMESAPTVSFDAATNVASWSGSDNVAKYRLEVSTVPFASTNVAGGANVRVYVLDGETTSQALNTLQAGQTYYFRVRAHRADGAGISAWSYATWTASELAAPSDVSFVQNGDVARVNWTDVALETGYRVEYRAVGEDAWTVGAERKEDFEYAFLKGLQAETTYEYRVVAVSGSAESASAVSTFTLTSVPTVAFDAATNVASWSGSAAAAKYRLEVSTVPFASSSVSSGANVRVYVLDGETTSQALDTLQAGQTYYFRVRAHQADGSGVSAWSNVVEYTVPALSAPSDVSFVQNGDVARINWTDVALESGYRVEYRAVGEDAWTVGAERKADFEYAFLRGLQSDATYEYRVVAVSGSAESASAVSTFTLTSVPTVAFDAATNVASWSGSAAAAKYRLEVSTVPFASSSVSSGANVRVYVLDGETTSQALNTLQAGQTYYFRVRAHQADGSGVSAWSDVVEYTVPTSESSEVVSDAFAELFAEEADDDFWFEFEKALGGRK